MNGSTGLFTIRKRGKALAQVDRLDYVLVCGLYHPEQPATQQEEHRARMRTGKGALTLPPGAG